MEEDETKPLILNSTKTSSNDDRDVYANITSPYKNGINRLEMLMSMTGDLNRNLPVSAVVSESSRSSIDTGQDRHYVRGLNTESNRHASQLLKAAASVVSNGLHSLYGNDSHSVSHLPASNEASDRPTVTTNNTILDNCTTVVSSSTKPTMSTGFPPVAQLQPKFSDTRIINSSTTDLVKTYQTAYAVSPVIKSERVEALPKTGKASTTVVPLLWKRVHKEGAIQYCSPTGEILTSLEEVKKYLLSEETCKCGLVCPFHVEKVFIFDPAVESQEWKLSNLGINSEKSVRTCCHRKHIRSTALAKDCKTLPKPSKPSPSRRRAKPSAQKSGVRKSATKESKHILGVVEEAENMRGHSAVTSNSANTTPIPPIETVMRGSVYTPLNEHTGLQSPNASPSMSMLSMHSATNHSGHMLPGIGPGNYPPPHPSSFVPPIYRHAMETEMMSPGNHPIYFPGMQGIGHPHGPMPAYHNPPGYEYMPSQHRPWNSPPAMHPMPPPGAQFGPSAWPPRPEANSSRKRRRRTSSISSNGGNSDTGYTSGLSSPAHTSPGQNKLHEKADGGKPKVTDERKPYQHTESLNAVKVIESNGVMSRQTIIQRALDAKSNNQPNATQETNIRHTSVIRSPEIRLPPTQASAHIPAPPYVPPGQRVPKPSTSSAYPTSHQPLPPIQLSDRTPVYTQPHTRAQVIRGVYSRPSLSNDIRPSDIQQTSAPRSYPGESLPAEDGGLSVINRLTKSSTSSTEAAPSSESEPQDLTTSNGVASRRMSETSLLTQHAGIIPSSHFVQQPMYMNGFQGGQLNPHMVPSMPYASPGLPPEYNYPPRHPVHMMRAPNGQLFYRYAQPRIPMAPQVMPYAVDNSMYSQMPFMASQGASFGYPSPANQNPPASPKRKRKKTGTKTIIESHSAVLARTDNGPDSTEPSKSAEPGSAGSKPV